MLGNYNQICCKLFQIQSSSHKVKIEDGTRFVLSRTLTNGPCHGKIDPTPDDQKWQITTFLNGYNLITIKD